MTTEILESKTQNATIVYGFGAINRIRAKAMAGIPPNQMQEIRDMVQAEKGEDASEDDLSREIMRRFMDTLTPEEQSEFTTGKILEQSESVEVVLVALHDPINRDPKGNPTVVWAEGNGVTAKVAVERHLDQHLGTVIMNRLRDVMSEGTEVLDPKTSTETGSLGTPSKSSEVTQ